MKLTFLLVCILSLLGTFALAQTPSYNRVCGALFGGRTLKQNPLIAEINAVLVQKLREDGLNPESFRYFRVYFDNSAPEFAIVVSWNDSVSTWPSPYNLYIPKIKQRHRGWRPFIYSAFETADFQNVMNSVEAGESLTQGVDYSLKMAQKAESRLERSFYWGEALRQGEFYLLQM